MLSLPKIIVIAAVFLAVWYAVRWLNRQPTGMARRRPPRGRGPQSAQRIEAEDLVACATCGAYVATTARSCGRTACPHPR